MPTSHQNNVEAARGQPPQAHQVVTGRTDESPALACGDACGSPPEGLGAALTYLDKDQGLAFGTDQIDLTESALVVACQQAQAGCLEVCRGKTLGLCAKAIHRGRAMGPAYSRCCSHLPP